MLVLSRKLSESICVGEDIVIKVVKIRGSVVGLGIVAPNDVKIMRNELIERDRQIGLKDSGDCRPRNVPKSQTSATPTKLVARIARTHAVSDRIDTRSGPYKGIAAPFLPIASKDVNGLSAKHSAAS